MVRRMKPRRECRATRQAAHAHTHTHTHTHTTTDGRQTDTLPDRQTDRQTDRETRQHKQITGHTGPTNAATRPEGHSFPSQRHHGTDHNWGHLVTERNRAARREGGGRGGRTDCGRGGRSCGGWPCVYTRQLGNSPPPQTDLTLLNRQGQQTHTPLKTN